MNAPISFIRKPKRPPSLANVAVLGQAGANAGRLRLPLFLSRISAGFPSPADDYVEGRLSLDEHLVARPEATFFLRVRGDSMVGAGIHDGDLLIVDKSLTPQHGSIVIAEIHGELTVKRLCRKNGEIALLAENPAYRAISVNEESHGGVGRGDQRRPQSALRQARCSPWSMRTTSMSPAIGCSIRA